MKRSKPLRQRTPLRARSLTKAYRRRKRDLDYMAIVRRLPCVVRAWVRERAFYSSEMWPEELGSIPFVLGTKCSGRVQADHLGKHGLGEKAADDTCGPMCEQHHRERTDYSGSFKNWNGVQMRAWCEWAILRTQEDVARLR